MKITSLTQAVPLFSLIFATSWLAASAPPKSPNSSPALAFPVKCEIGLTCLIQKLVDHDVGPGRRDYRCGTLTTDGHDGVDIRLRTMDDMRSGYGVLASAVGTVLRTRDGEPDTGPRDPAGLNGRDAGNGVVIDHGDGWETQYSHLQQGSVLVEPGQRVAAGQPLGLVGLSGNTEFPHLHFTVRYRGTAIDPFTGSSQGGACSALKAPVGLWSTEAGRALGYAPTAIISIGLASSVPPKSVVSRVTGEGPLGRAAPVLLWADVIGAKTGDIQNFTITGPNGRELHAQQNVVAGGGLSWFAYSGKRAPAGGWQAGSYIGHYTIQRNGKTISEAKTYSTM